MTKKRTKALGLAAASLAALPFLLPTTAGANAGPGYVGSSNNPDSYPPMPAECVGGQLWAQWVGDPNAVVLSKSNPFVVTGLTVGAGHITVTEAITWDAREKKHDRKDDQNLQPSEAGEGLEAQAVLDEGAADDGVEAQGHQNNKPELFEKMRVEFYKDGNLVGSTPFHTPDLPDDKTYAWSVSALGTLDLAEGADAVVLKHASGFMKTDGRENAFMPKAVCIKVTPFEVPTTTTPPTTAPPVTEPPTTAPPVTEAPTEVLPQVVEAEELAFTGSETNRNLGIGAGLLALGTAMLGVTRRRRQHA